MKVKELSIEEKARRYDEAIKKLRNLHDDYDCVSTLIDIKKELEYIFPELAESEDERIRKWLEEHIEAMPDNSIEFKDVKRIDVLHWLEKQDEQKPADKVKPKFKVGDIVKHKNNPYLTYILKRFTDDGDYEFHAIGKDGIEGCTCFSVVKYQDEWELAEQEPIWEPSGEQMKILQKYAEQNNYDGRILTWLYNDLKKLRMEGGKK